MSLSLITACCYVALQPRLLAFPFSPGATLLSLPPRVSQTSRPDPDPMSSFAGTIIDVLKGLVTTPRASQS